MLYNGHRRIKLYRNGNLINAVNEVNQSNDRINSNREGEKLNLKENNQKNRINNEHNNSIRIY